MAFREVLLAAAFLFASAHCFSKGVNSNVVHMDLSLARGMKPSLAWMYPRGTRREPATPSGEPVILCTDTSFPNDFSCDLRGLYASKAWKTRPVPDISFAKVRYEDPQTPGSTCVASFEKAGDHHRRRGRPLLRLSYSRVKCGTRGVMVKDAPPFAVAAISAFNIYLRDQTDDRDRRCKFFFDNRGRVEKRVGSRGGRNATVVKFAFPGTKCVSSPTGLGVGRSAKLRVRPCVSDGRRCRPLKDG